MDRVQVVKQESAALGGDAADEAPYDSPIDPREDAIEAAGVFLQDAANRDESTLVARSGDDMTFKDVSNPTAVTLTELITGTGGLTEASHKVLRQLIHFLADGPGDNFSTAPHKETTWSGVKITDEVWYESVSKAKKLTELVTTWTGIKITQEELTVYDTDGTSWLVKATDAITYTGLKETGRTRTFSYPP